MKSKPAMLQQNHTDLTSTATKPCLQFGYEANDLWAKLPIGWSWTEVVAVATDAEDHVYVFNRGEHAVMVFNPDGTFLHSWGEGLFARPHGIFIGPDGAVYCTDDLDHTVRKFTPDGRLLLTLGTSGKPSKCTFAMATATQGCTSFRLMAGLSFLLANRGTAPDSFRCPTASRSIGKGRCTWLIVRTVASSSSRPTAGSFPNGPMLRARVRSSSTRRGMCLWPSWVFAQVCGPVPPRPPPMRQVDG